MNTTTHEVRETETADAIREAVRQRYAAIARAGGSGGACCSEPGDAPAEEGACCGGGEPAAEGACCVDAQARRLGYSEEDAASVPEGANLGLGCGNPTALAELRPGERVLDLGSGAGFDAFLAARAVGPGGRVIGVDMTPEMVERARSNARKAGATNVEFRLGEIEALPVADGVVDVVLSNCVINLCPDKRPVYREAFRALRSGGRLVVSDVVARSPLPEAVRRDLALHTGCLAGATVLGELLEILAEAGFVDVSVEPRGNSDEIITSWESKRGFEKQVEAAVVRGRKP